MFKNAHDLKRNDETPAAAARPWWKRLVLPTVLLFIMGLFEYGRYFLMVHV